MIKVTDLITGGVVFTGELEDFLYFCNNDSDVELFLETFELTKCDSDILSNDDFNYLVEREEEV
jgi:hypothetical protein